MYHTWWHLMQLASRLDILSTEVTLYCSIRMPDLWFVSYRLRVTWNITTVDQNFLQYSSYLEALLVKDVVFLQKLRLTLTSEQEIYKGIKDPKWLMTDMLTINSNNKGVLIILKPVRWLNSNFYGSHIWLKLHLYAWQPKSYYNVIQPHVRFNVSISIVIIANFPVTLKIPDDLHPW